MGELFVVGINGESKDYKNFTPKMRKLMKEKGGSFLLPKVFANWLNFPELHNSGAIYTIPVVAWVCSIPKEKKEQIEKLHL